MEHVDFVEKIHIAAYWRKQLGEYEYVNHNPDDLLRWYLALETRGPNDVRSYLAERASRYQTSVVTGVVAEAPHPPLTIVELWLASHSHASTAPYWTAAVAFCLFAYLAGTNLHGCAALVDPNLLASRPPQTNIPLQPGGFSQLPAAPSTLPSQVTPPANPAAPTSGQGASPH